MVMPQESGVLLLSHGTVEKTADIPIFMSRIRHGRPAPPALVAEVCRRYEVIGRSPLLDMTVAQASALSARLDAPVFVGTRYSSPRIEDALLDAHRAGVRRLAVLALAPYSGQAYDNAARAALAAVVRETPGVSLQLVSVPFWGTDPKYVASVVGHVRACLAKEPDDAAEIVLSAHSLPIRALLGGDSYATLVGASALAVGCGLGRSFRIAYQSQGAADAGPWLGPDLRSTMEFLALRAASGPRASVVVVPFGFLAEHVETLYDLDVEAKQWADALGLVYRRLPTLGTDPAFIDALASQVERSLCAPSPS